MSQLKIRPNEGYKKRFTPKLVDWLTEQLTARTTDIDAAMVFIWQHGGWGFTVQILLDEDSPDDEVYWVSLDAILDTWHKRARYARSEQRKLLLRYSIGGFDNYKDGHSEESLMAQFRRSRTVLLK